MSLLFHVICYNPNHFQSIRRIKEIEKEKNDIIEKHDKVLRDLRRKTESTMESMMKENTNATSKVSDISPSKLHRFYNYLAQTVCGLPVYS